MDKYLKFLLKVQSFFFFYLGNIYIIGRYKQQFFSDNYYFNDEHFKRVRTLKIKKASKLSLLAFSEILSDNISH